MGNHANNPAHEDCADRSDRSTRYKFTADRFSYVALGGLPFVFSVVFTYFYAFGNYDHDHPVWPLALLAYAVFVGILLYLKAFRVTIRDGLLSYRLLFRGTRSIKFSDIKQARVDTKRLTARSGRPPYALFIEPLPGVDAPPFAINIKLLGRGDLRTLFDILGDKVSDPKHRMDRVLGKRIRRP
jgi:hypothetical protein